MKPSSAKGCLQPRAAKCEAPACLSVVFFFEVDGMDDSGLCLQSSTRKHVVAVAANYSPPSLGSR